jgi:hypothetical protein
MVHGVSEFTPALGDALTERTFLTFFEVLGLLLRGGVTTVAEAAFQDHLWRPRLEPFAPIADIRIIECVADAEARRARRAARDAASAIRKAAHVGGRQEPIPFGWISLDVPKLRVDTTDGYAPDLPEMVAFIATPSLST